MNTASRNKPLRILFMGTPDFAVGSLQAILEAGLQVVGVITAPDRPAGRGRKIQYSAIKEFALQRDLVLLQPTNLKDKGFLEELRALAANLQVVVAFRMLPKQVWEMPELGTFNLHASLLPQYRGAAPINWAIMGGDTRTGVTTFFIDEKIDTGNIILQAEEPIFPEDDAGSLQDRLKALGAELVVRTCHLIGEGTAKRVEQREAADLRPAPKIDKETCRIDWNAPLARVHDHIRGLSPYPGAWSLLVNGQREEPIKIFKGAMEAGEHKLPPGTLVRDKNSLKVALKDGFLELLELQMPGKRRMKIREVLNGLNLENDSHLR